MHVGARGGAGEGTEIRRQRHIGTTRVEDSDATFSDLGLLPLRKLYLFMYFSRYFVYSVFFLIFLASDFLFLFFVLLLFLFW